MKHTYVVYVDNNKYIAPAIVLAYSIQKNNSSFTNPIDDELIVFINNKLSNDEKNILSLFYDKVKVSKDYEHDLKKINRNKKIILITNPNMIILDKLNELDKLDKKTIDVSHEDIPNNKIIMFQNSDNYLLESDIDISVRVKNNDNILWHKLYSEILSNNTKLKNNVHLNNTNELHKYFSQRIFNMRIMARTNNINNADNADNALYESKNLCFTPDSEKLYPLFENINPFDYFAPIEHLAKNFKSKYYSELVEKKVNLPNISLDKIMLNTNIDIEDIDNIALQYIMCRPKTQIILFFNEYPERIEKITKIDNELSQHGNVYYIRHVLLSYKGIRNLMFWMYNDIPISQRPYLIDDKILTLNLKSQDMNQITLILFDNINNTQDYEENLIKLIRHNLIYISDSFYKTINLSQLLLNKNSVSLLNIQNIILNTDKHLQFQTFRKKLYTNLSLLEISKIFLIGGSVFYAYGIRDFTQITSIMVDPNDTELEQLMFDMFTNETTKLQFTNMSIEGKFWKEKWSKKNKKLTDFFDIESIHDIATNPRYHFYYQGLKFYLIDHEIVRRLIRGKNEDYADIMMIIVMNPKLINKYVKIDYNIEKIVLSSNMFKKKNLDHKLIYSNILLKYSQHNSDKVDEALIKRYI